MDLKQRESRLLRLIVNDKAIVDRLLIAHAWYTATEFLSDTYETVDADKEGRSTGAVIEEVARKMFGPDGDFFRDAPRKNFDCRSDIVGRLEGKVLSSEIVPVSMKKDMD